MIEERTLSNLTTCSECITLTLSVPKDCRLDVDIVASRVSEMFKKELLRDLCYGCPLEKRQA